MASQATNDALDQEIADAILGARYFLVSIYHDGGFAKHPLVKLADALAACPLLEQKHQSNRRAMIYAVGADDRSTMIPRIKAERAAAFLAGRK